MSDSWQAPDLPIGLGRIGIGLLNSAPQPFISREGRYLLDGRDVAPQTARACNEVQHNPPAPCPSAPAAISSERRDGVEERTIVLAIERNTKVMEPVVRDGNE